MGFKGSKVQILSSRPAQILRDYTRIPQGGASDELAPPFSFGVRYVSAAKCCPSYCPLWGKRSGRLYILCIVFHQTVLNVPFPLPVMPRVPFSHPKRFMTDHFFNVFQRATSVKHVCAIGMAA